MILVLLVCIGLLNWYWLFLSHPLAKEQMEAVESVLAELNVEHIPRLTVWNKVNAESPILVHAVQLAWMSSNLRKVPFSWDVGVQLTIYILLNFEICRIFPVNTWNHCCREQVMWRSFSKFLPWWRFTNSPLSYGRSTSTHTRVSCQEKP